MRNVLKICTVMALALILVLGMFSSAFAASSQTDIVEFWDDTEKVSETATFEGVPELTAEDAKALAEADVDLKQIWLGDVWGDTLKLECRIQEGKGTYYIFHYKAPVALAKATAEEGEWEFVQSGEGDKFDVTFTSLSPVAVFQAADIAQTGDNSNMYLWGGLMIVAAAAAIGTVVYSKKRRNEA